jgi:hypothetical protein
MLTADKHRKEMRMYKVFKVEGGYEIFWCPSAHEKIELNVKKIYSTHQAAYRRAKQLNNELQQDQPGESGKDAKKVA